MVEMAAAEEPVVDRNGARVAAGIDRLQGIPTKRRTKGWIKGSWGSNEGSLKCFD